MWRAERIEAPSTWRRSPSEVRLIRNQTTRAAATATSRPTWTPGQRREADSVPGIDGSSAVKSNARVCGVVVVGSWNGPLTRICARLMPMKVIISVVMISLSS